MNGSGIEGSRGVVTAACRLPTEPNNALFGSLDEPKALPIRLIRLLDGGKKGFEQGISVAQYQKVARVSKATATRHLAGLVEKGCLVKLPGGGRSTRYRVAKP